MTQNVAALLDVKSRKSLCSWRHWFSHHLFVTWAKCPSPFQKSLPLSLFSHPTSSYSIHADLGFSLPSLGDIPEGLFQQMITCHTAANEFLRQFWSAIYPSPVDSQSISSIATPAQRASKAAKMVGYLSKTPEKVEALVRMAQQHGVNGSKVETVKISLYIWIFCFCSCFRLMILSLLVCFFRLWSPCWTLSIGPSISNATRNLNKYSPFKKSLWLTTAHLLGLCTTHCLSQHSFWLPLTRPHHAFFISVYC